ncbi:hypothetical protein [Mycobacterium marinum]|uniref:hypothetical protein n=1 Tax=Mycobacterium marinum TaxID=1781 RepID=UPI003569404E
MTNTRRRLERADLTDSQKLHARACFHEAGHAVVCAMLGGEIDTAVVSNGRVTGCKGSPPSSTALTPSTPE